MKQIIYILTICAGMISLNGCVEKSAKYQTLSNRVDSLNAVNNAMSDEFENVLSEINDVTQGLQRVREAHQLLSVATQKEGKVTNRATKQLVQIKTDVETLSNTIENYNKKIASLEANNAKQSTQLRKLIAGLKEELEASKSQMQVLNSTLEQKETELKQKGIIIEQLSGNISDLNSLTGEQKKLLQLQENALNQINYLIGSTKDLKNKGVITRRGLFAPPVIATQAIEAGFTVADMRELTRLNIDAKKVKLISVHATDSYQLSEESNNQHVLEIINPKEFWKNTRYLVIQTN